MMTSLTYKVQDFVRTPMSTVFMGTGCRVGEIVGLRWEDCDFENSIISINHNITYMQQENGNYVKKALLNERKKQLEMGLGSLVIDGYSGFVYTNRVGNIYIPNFINIPIKTIINAYNMQEEITLESKIGKQLP